MAEVQSKQLDDCEANYDFSGRHTADQVTPAAGDHLRSAVHLFL